MTFDEYDDSGYESEEPEEDSAPDWDPGNPDDIGLEAMDDYVTEDADLATAEMDHNMSLAIEPPREPKSVLYPTGDEDYRSDDDEAGFYGYGSE